MGHAAPRSTCSEPGRGPAMLTAGTLPLSSRTSANERSRKSPDERYFATIEALSDEENTEIPFKERTWLALALAETALPRPKPNAVEATTIDAITALRRKKGNIGLVSLNWVGVAAPACP